MAKLDDLRDLLDRVAREPLVLSVGKVEAIMWSWCDKHHYDEWRVQRHLFDYRIRVWLYFPEFKHSYAWHPCLGVDIELEPPHGHCPWCGDGLWDECCHFHCGRKPCRDMYWFWSAGPWPKNRPFGEPMYPYMIAEFIKRMAYPKTKKQLEFSKRYAHRRAK